ncbi:MAG: tRNA (guanosine(37)-N1)-methyltransferase TrmD [Kofleriaceae bacterium]|nr:tRNA (guanosine(37)-N1)-methyltransferase TrmD [Kofleriaceae bacterium]
MNFTVVTLLPELIEGAFAAGVVGRGRDAGLIVVTTVNPRDFTTDKHRTVDDTPYGGGPGMVMKAEPLLAAIDHAGRQLAPPAHRIALTPSGRPLTQQRVRELATLPHLVLVCGRYEGMDQRVLDTAIDEELSIGDYVLSGGELGALVIIDAVARLVPGVLGEPESATDESFAGALLEYPQYTRPALVATSVGELGVPGILSSGNHAAIADWRRQQAMQRTAQRRPELWAQHRVDKHDRKLLKGLPALDIAARCYVALVHHPVRDRTGLVVTTALTNLDLHDIARSTTTYGLAGFYVVTPIDSQRDKAEQIGTMWRETMAGEHRTQALASVRVAADVAAAVAAITAEVGVAPLVVATAANLAQFAEVETLASTDLLQRSVQVASADTPMKPILLMFGTGWGLVAEQLPMVDLVLRPITGAPDWNHLSVRSAVAITLDRLFGKSERRPGPP